MTRLPTPTALNGQRRNNRKRRILAAYVARKLSPEQQDAVCAYLESAPGARRYVRQLMRQQTARVRKAIPQPATPNRWLLIAGMVCLVVVAAGVIGLSFAITSDPPAPLERDDPQPAPRASGPEAMLHAFDALNGRESNVWAFAADPKPAPVADKGTDAKHYDEKVRPFLVKYCQRCHKADDPEKGYRVDTLTADFANKTNARHWKLALKQIDEGTMPPEDEKKQPTKAESQAVSEWVNRNMAAAEAAQRGSQGRVVLRRLNRAEYENTMHDLLGIDIPLKGQLPRDGEMDGFDNVGSALHMSSFLLEKYLETADRALNVAIANGPRPKVIKKRFLLKDQHVVKRTTENVYRHLEDATVHFVSSEWHVVGITEFYPQDSERGNYRFRISASAYQSNGKPVTFRVGSGSRGGQSGKGGIVGYFDAPADKPTVFEFVEHIEPRQTISILPYGLGSANTVKLEGAEKWKGPGLAVQWVEVEGPLNETWPPAGHRRIFGDLPQAAAPIYNFRDRVEVVSKNPAVDAERILKGFMRRAFRRAVTDNDVKPYLTLVKAKLADKQTFEQAVRVGLLAIMLSPDFLFLHEKPGKLDDFALASRLSYFLWSTMPDEELLTLAEQKKLNQPDVLRKQVDRMLNHAKALAFTENFLGQWLSLRDIDFTQPSHILYPEFDHLLKVSMLKETELFFGEVIKNDLSLTNFVSSEFSMLNGRLGKHYGISGITGSWDFQKVTLPKDSHRGGLMTMGSVLKVTADGTNTTPIKRGAWVMDRLVGKPPPEPPADVPSLQNDTRGAATIREQLAKHRAGTCAACHAKFDFAGFALESFDVIGGWRDNYRTSGSGAVVTVDGRRMPYHMGKKVDPSDTMPDGQKFNNVDEFKQLLLKDKDQIARSLTQKLMTYATGGAPETADKPEVEAVVQKARDKNYGFRTLIHEVVQSKVFQTK